MIPLNRCIQLLDYTAQLSDEQKMSIIYYLKKLKMYVTNSHNDSYSTKNSNIPLNSKFITLS